MFVFQSHEHLCSVIQELNKLSFDERDVWFKQWGINTYGRVFNKVILAEDSISNYYENLSPEKQNYFRSMPQVFSKAFHDALSKNIIKIVKESDNSYFDVNLYDKDYADFVNLLGEIKIGNNVYLINECEAKIYTNVKDGDLQNYNKSQLLIVNDDQHSNMKSSNINTWSEIKSPIYYDKNWLGKNRKKVWAEILGESYMNISFNDETNTCCRSVYSNFVLKGFAQKRNFWVNYVFTSEFAPLINMKGTWDYEYCYWHYDDNPSDGCLCGYYSHHKSYGYNDFPSYYCAPIHNHYCPTSPIDMSYNGNCWSPTVSPTGIFSYTVANNLWWAQPFRIYNIDITITIDGKAFYF